MNFRRLVSAVAALAVAGTCVVTSGVSVLAAVDKTYSFAATNRSTVTTNEDDTITITAAANAANQYGLATVDFSDAIEDNTGTITVSFDSTMASGTRWLIGLGDKDVRGTTANGSSKATYNTTGLMYYFGTSNGTTYTINGSGSYGDSAFGTLVHTSVTLDRSAGTYSYTMTADGATTPFASAEGVSTSVGTISILEVYTWLNSATITMSSVNVVTTDSEAAIKTYTVKAVSVDDESEVLGTITTGQAGAGLPASATVSEYIQGDDGSYYKLADDTVSGYTKSFTMDADNDTTVTVKYESATDVVYYSEGEALENNIGATSGTAYSNGGYSAVAGAKKATIGTYSAGDYTLTIYLVANGNRGIYVRNVSDPDNTTNTIAYVDIDKNSSAGVYTVDFTLTAETDLMLSGYTNSSGNVNQSADIDYVILEEVKPKITATTTTTDVTTDPSISAADEGSVAIYNSDSKEFESTTAPELSGTVTTVYVKVENVDDADLTVPYIYIEGDENSPYYSHKDVSDLATTINGNTYFIYQFYGIDLTGATVDCSGVTGQSIDD